MADTTWPVPISVQSEEEETTNADRSLQLATSANHRLLCFAARTQKKARRKRSGGMQRGSGAF